ncbi:transcription factor YY2 [Nannospalax galili]|uniref:transcription factor YY2 n=1 Tax=Nannospalax galili TaxID=1026970 RepID=UPI0004ED6A04|nr:transcription factor YY2 [Nannospalax galili]
MASEKGFYIVPEEVPADLLELQPLQPFSVDGAALEVGAFQTVELHEDGGVGVSWAQDGHLSSDLYELQPFASSLNNRDHDEDKIIVEMREEVVDYEDTDALLAKTVFNQDGCLQSTMTSLPGCTVAESDLGQNSLSGGNLCDVSSILEASAEGVWCPEPVDNQWKQKQVQMEDPWGDLPFAMWATNDENEEPEANKESTNSPLDYSEYMKGKKFPPEGIPGIDLSDPKQLAEFTSMKLKKPKGDFPRPIPCSHESCGKMFKDSSTMKKHLHIHGPKVHTCAECGKAFVENSKLKRHQLVHTGEKPYQCTFEGCGRRFSLDFNLRTHVRIHTGDKPFVCPFEGCSRKFAQSTNLRSHILTHVKSKSDR